MVNKTALRLTLEVEGLDTHVQLFDDGTFITSEEIAIFADGDSLESGLLKVINGTYSDGATSIESWELDGDTFTGVFLDRIDARRVKRYEFEIDSEEVSFKLRNPKSVARFSELPSELTLLAKGKGKKKNCIRGTACGNSCISGKKTCTVGMTAAQKKQHKANSKRAKAQGSSATESQPKATKAKPKAEAEAKPTSAERSAKRSAPTLIKVATPSGKPDPEGRITSEGIAAAIEKLPAETREPFKRFLESRKVGLRLVREGEEGPLGYTSISTRSVSVNIQSGLLKLAKQDGFDGVSLAELKKEAIAAINSHDETSLGSQRSTAFFKGNDKIGEKTAPALSRSNLEFSTFLHEVGHQVHFNAGIRKFEGIEVSAYASFNNKERFAEAFSAWVVAPRAYAKADPKGAATIRDWLGRLPKKRTRKDRIEDDAAAERDD